jgi:polyisoprenoid-binding protein YceI
MKLLCILALIAIPVLAERINVEIDPGSTRIYWSLGATVHTVHGTFKLKRGELWFDPDNRQAGGLLVVDATSGESGSDSRDGRMHKNVIESARHPEITFVPDHLDGKFTRTGDSDVQLHGMFTIHGGTHEEVMKVKSHAEGQKLTANISFTIPYVNWGMKDPSNFLLKVKDFVEIDIQAAAQIK